MQTMIVCLFRTNYVNGSNVVVSAATLKQDDRCRDRFQADHQEITLSRAFHDSPEACLQSGLNSSPLNKVFLTKGVCTQTQVSGSKDNVGVYTDEKAILPAVSHSRVGSGGF